MQKEPEKKGCCSCGSGKDNSQKNNKNIIPLGSFDFAGKGPGSYLGGVVKLRGDLKKDLLDSAESFLKASGRCLNDCKIEEGVEILTVPGTVCSALSCELFLKYIILIEKETEFKDHDLVFLFGQCRRETQSALSDLIADILDILERNKDHFVDARYHHERDCFSFRPQELLQTAEVFSKFVKSKYPHGEST